MKSKNEFIANRDATCDVMV